MKIVTNNHWREFYTVESIPTSILSDYEYLLADGEMPWIGWIFYRSRWFHLSDFLKTDHFKGWHGACPDSYFSGTLIELSGDGDAYKIGYYTS